MKYDLLAEKLKQASSQRDPPQGQLVNQEELDSLVITNEELAEAMIHAAEKMTGQSLNYW